MKNMRVSMKLIVGFLIVTVLAVGIGVLGIFTLTSSANNSATMADATTMAIAAARMNRNIQNQRASFRGAALYHMAGDMELRDNNLNELHTLQTDFDGFHAIIEPLLISDEAFRLFGEIDAAIIPFNSARDIFETGILDPAVTDEIMISQLNDVAATVAPVANAITEFVNFADNAGKTLAAESASTAQMTTWLLVGVMAAVAIISLFLAFYISGLISKPLIILTTFMKRAGGEGDILLSKDDEATIGRYGMIKDEIGQCISATARFVSHINGVADVLGSVADGDLTRDFTTLSEKDVMGISLNKMSQNLNNMFADINNASNQVSSGSVQIADGAQLLAQGATEQSATVEELSASVTEVNGQTKANANLADDAKKLGDDIKTNAERGNTQMEQMIKAVGEISDASTAIGKVIKIIDDIAFQTNILALNAAVEAARAGQHGKGFAVVADEVRSLAAKSADAAKNTSELIATSIEKSEQGAAISKETAESLGRIVEGIIQSSELVAKIAQSSNEQSIAIGQIGEAIDQVSQVIQQNSATAEESAAASEQMSGQATMLQQLISQFKLKNQDAAGRGAAPRPGAAAPVPVAAASATGFSVDGSGKY